MFSAYLYKYHSFNGIIDSFDTVPVNIGNCFTASTGIFRPTKSGIYELSFAMYHSEHGQHRLSVLKNGNKVNGLRFFAQSDSKTSNDDLLSVHWYMELNKYDTIKLSVAEGQKFTSGDYYTSVFSGKYVRSSKICFCLLMVAKKSESLQTEGRHFRSTICKINDV